MDKETNSTDEYWEQQKRAAIEEARALMAVASEKLQKDEKPLVKSKAKELLAIISAAMALIAFLPTWLHSKTFLFDYDLVYILDHCEEKSATGEYDIDLWNIGKKSMGDVDKIWRVQLELENATFESVTVSKYTRQVGTVNRCPSKKQEQSTTEPANEKEPMAKSAIDKIRPTKKQESIKKADCRNLDLLMLQSQQGANINVKYKGVACPTLKMSLPQLSGLHPPRRNTSLGTELADRVLVPSFLIAFAVTFLIAMGFFVTDRSKGTRQGPTSSIVLITLGSFVIGFFIAMGTGYYMASTLFIQ